jgi:ketosteroid isomerase-like protein
MYNTEGLLDLYTKGIEKENSMQLTTDEVIRKFNDAFLAHDGTVLSEIVADDCVLENTGPAPDGATYKGHAACVEFWTGIATNKGMWFETENVDILGDRAIITWRLAWGNEKSDSVRGVNIMRVHDGKIVEALGYVKA